MDAATPIFLFTDFGAADIYVGQVKAVLLEACEDCPVIDLLHDVPNFAIEPAAHLLAALATRLPPRAVTIAVVDPGVGGARDAIAIEAGARWYVGPDNGLLSVLAARHGLAHYFSLRLPAPQSISFHGRDLFAPAAARIASGSFDGALMSPKAALDVQLSSGCLPQIVYIDHYGNAITGLNASRLNASVQLGVAGRTISHARVFSAVPPGTLFWYENSMGLAEIAANQASAQSLLGLVVSQPVQICSI